MRALLDEAGLVHMAAAATATDPGVVLASADIAALASVMAAVEQATTPLDAAATAVLEVGRRRPFGADSVAVAWLTAAFILSKGGRRLRIGPVTASSVMLAGPALEVADVVTILVEHSEPRRGPVLDRLRRLVETYRADRPGVTACPACGRPLVLRHHDLTAVGVWEAAARQERIARCATQHRQHDRRGIPREVPTTTNPAMWERIADGPGLTTLAIGPEGAAVLRPCDDGFEAVAVDDLRAGDLLGDWERLFERGRALGNVGTPS